MHTISQHTILFLLSLTSSTHAYKCAPSIPNLECVARAKSFSASVARPAFSCLPSVPAASCLVMASAFSASLAQNSRNPWQQEAGAAPTPTTFQTAQWQAPQPTKAPQNVEIFMRRQQRDILVPAYDCDMNKVTPDECRRQAVSFSSRVTADLAKMARQGGMPVGGTGPRGGNAGPGTRPGNGSGSGNVGAPPRGGTPVGGSRGSGSIPKANTGGTRGSSSGSKGSSSGGSRGKGRLVEMQDEVVEAIPTDIPMV